MSVQFSHSVMSNSLWPHELQHARPPCPSPTPRVYSNSCPLSQWCHPTISSSVVLFFSHLQSWKHTKHILIKLTKTKPKERIFKAAREKQQVTYTGNPIPLTADLSAETLQARREGQDIFKTLKGKNLQPRLLYPARISFKIDGEIKTFSDKQKLREFSTTQPALQQMSKGLI